MTLMLTLLFLAVAVGAGVALNLRRGRDSTDDDTDGASVLNVLEATALLAGLLVAIVLSDASGLLRGSFRSQVEADTVDALYESAEYVELPARQAIQAAVVCYARAVAGPEWDAMEEGGTSRVPNNWTGTGPFGIRRALIGITPEDQGFVLVQPGDQARGEAAIGSRRPGRRCQQFSTGSWFFSSGYRWPGWRTPSRGRRTALR